MAVAANRTRIHWGQNHFCRKHNSIVKKDYIDECDLINKKDSKVTQYNELLARTYLYNIPKDKLKAISKHYCEPEKSIEQLESEGIYVPVNRAIVLAK